MSKVALRALSVVFFVSLIYVCMFLFAYVPFILVAFCAQDCHFVINGETQRVNACSAAPK